MNVRTAPVRKTVLSVAGALVIGLVLAEVLLHVAARPLGLDVLRMSTPAPRSIYEGGASPYSFDSTLGYELKPNAVITHRIDDGHRGTEKLSSDGFRNPEYPLAKPPGVVRLLAVGHSVVQGLESPPDHSWTSVLEGILNHPGASARYQVLNAAVGGYRARQADVRMERRGLKYQPNVVLVMVGWNDLFYSSLPIWTRDIDLTRIEAAWLRMNSDTQQRTRSAQVKQAILRVSYLARLTREVRNAWYNRHLMREIVAQRQHDAGIPFNDEALRIYLADLEHLHASARRAGARVALITEPTILSAPLLNDPDIHRKLLQYYLSFPLSTREIWSWHTRYVDAQRQFAAQHPDIILIDAENAFQRFDKPTRLRYFVDLAHLTPEGNRMLASLVKDALAPASSDGSAMVTRAASDGRTLFAQ